MPEIAGDLFDYFDPSDAQGLLELTMKYSQDYVSLARKVRVLKNDYAPHGWDESAEFLRQNIWNTIK